MKEKPLISIVVPVYKVEKYLVKCIESILNQTYSNIEVILINDGSPDRCPYICEEYKAKDSRVKVVHKKNGGLSDARNFGIEIAKGEFISFIDSDDFISKDYVEYLYNMIKKFEADISICGIKRIYKKTKIGNEKHNQYLEFTSETAIENMLFDEGINISSYAKLFKLKAFNTIKFPVGKVYEDSATTYLLFHNSNKIVYGDKECYFYLTRSGSISKMGNFNKNEYDFINHTTLMLDFVKKEYPNIIDSIKRYEIYSNFRILRMILLSKSRNIDLEEKVVDKIEENKYEVLRFKRTPKRDKLAITIFLFGKNMFKLAWIIYSKITGRIE